MCAATVAEWREGCAATMVTWLSVGRLSVEGG